jgi:chromate transporter
MKKTRLLYDLMLTFMRIGLFTFGGGYAMIALMDNECVEKKKWISHDDFMDIIVIAESTPGPIAINGATYIGYRQAGLFGAVIATAGMVLPSFAVVYLISLFFDNILEIRIIANAFRGINIAVGVLILSAAMKMVKRMHKKAQPLIIMACALITSLCVHLFGWRFSSIYMIMIAGVAGYLIFIIGRMRNDEGGGKR